MKYLFDMTIEEVLKLPDSEYAELRIKTDRVFEKAREYIANKNKQ